MSKHYEAWSAALKLALQMVRLQVWMDGAFARFWHEALTPVEEFRLNISGQCAVVEFSHSGT